MSNLDLIITNVSVVLDDHPEPQRVDISVDSGRLTIQNMKGFARVTDPIGR